MSLEPSDVAPIVSVAGEIDLATAPSLREGIDDAVESGAVRVLVDLTETTFVDSSGISALLAARRRLARRNGGVAVVATNPAVVRMFELSGLTETLKVSSTREAGLAALDP